MSFLKTFIQGSNTEILSTVPKIWEQRVKILDDCMAINQPKSRYTKKIDGIVELITRDSGLSLVYVTDESLLGFKIGDKEIRTDPFDTLLIEEQGTNIQIVNQEGQIVEHNLSTYDQGKIALFAGTAIMGKFASICAHAELGL